MASIKNAIRALQMGIFAQAHNHVVMSGWLNYPVYQDATATPVVSPVALTSTPTLINVPAAAAEITILGAVAVTVSDTANSADGAMLIPANVPITIPLVTPTSDPNGTTGQLWLSTASTGNCSFFFGCV
jgi:hypothetical protein